MKLFKTLAVAALAMVMSAGVVRAADLIGDIQKKGRMVVGVTTFIPWAVRAKDGSLIGYEIDVAKKLAEDIGVEVEFVPTAWDGIIPSLLAGKFDMIISGMSILPKRALQVNLSNPYSYNGLGMVVNKKMAGNGTWKTFEDFNKSDVIITIRRASPASSDAVKLRFPKAQIRQFDDDATAAQDVINGRAHAFLTPEPKPMNYAADNPEVLYRPFTVPDFPKTGAGIAIRKGDPDALAFLNTFITVHELDGYLAERQKYWFESRDWRSLVN